MTTAEMIRRYRAGESTDQIAAVSGLSVSGVRHRLRRHGVALRTVSEGLRLRLGKGIDDEEVARRYRDGESAAAIARSCGVSPPAIAGRLRALRIPLRTRTEANRLRCAQRDRLRDRIAELEAEVERLRTEGGGPR